MKKIATLALTVALSAAAFATVGCDGNKTASTTVKTTPTKP